MEKEFTTFINNDIVNLQYKVIEHLKNLKNNINSNYDKAKQQIEFIEFYEDLIDDLDHLLNCNDERLMSINESIDDNI